MSLAGAATSIIFVATSFVVTNTCLPWQNTSFVVTNTLLSRQFCCDKPIFVTTKVLSQQIFVMTNIILSWQKLQAYFCHDESMLVTTNVSCLTFAAGTSHAVSLYMVVGTPLLPTTSVKEWNYQSLCHSLCMDWNGPFIEDRCLKMQNMCIIKMHA